MDNASLAQKQAELSKALSKAYLTHQISELESQVRQLPISQDVSRANGIKQVARGPDTRGPAVARIDDDLEGLDDVPAVGAAPRRIDEDDGSDRELDTIEGDDKEDWRVAVVDVSGLMWAPKAVRALSAKGFEVVIPADGIRTLDLLKKGNSPSAIAARSAARYIEHASRQYKVLSADPSITVQLGTNYRRGSGLRIQRDDEFRKADELSSLPLMPGEEGPPKWVKSVLGCAAFFAGINKAEIETSFRRNDVDPAPVLYVANPPLAVELAQATNGVGPETKEMRDHAESHGNFLERGEGVVVLQEAERFELGLEVLRDDDDEAFDMRRSGGRGRGRGGRGGLAGPGGDRARSRAAKAKKEEEKQPEVKILLRRQPPATADPSAMPGSLPSPIPSDVPERSPLSDLSPLPDVFTQPPSGLLFASANGHDPRGGPSNVSGLAKSNSFGSAPSADISPPHGLSKPLPPMASERKSPASKFVPLTRETHPVRRQAGSSDSGHSQASRNGARRGGRGGGRGGAGSGARGGRGGGGAGRKKGGKERDSDFKNGNFTLLQRPTPPVETAHAPTPTPPPPPRPSAGPAPTTGKGARPVHTTDAKPAPKTILQRPAKEQEVPVPTLTSGTGPGPGPNARNGQARPPPAVGPPPFAPELRGRGRGRGGGGPRGAFRPPPPGPPHHHDRGGRPARPPPPHHHHHHQHPHHHGAPSPPVYGHAEGFEFDDAMLRPGFGSGFHGSFDHPPHPPPPPPQRGHGPFGRGHGHGHGHMPPFGRPPPDWQPAPEKPAVVMLQRPK